ncbi:hypothetical protein CMUS01_15475 [Colletotrichum musicola]|uniref:Uncharacterized protein n=1 Tax=Colletotrichum musicola TaxID=2175873 RepID=A0A8H6MN73_9PEZI|nr:hypothetical protein CMUS01_15475 [Colletotrichum musicola]
MGNIETASTILIKANNKTNEHPFTTIVNAWRVFKEVGREQGPLQSNAYMCGAQAPSNFRFNEASMRTAARTSSAYACSSGHDTTKRAGETSPRTVRHHGLAKPIQSSQAHMHLTNETKFFSGLVNRHGIQEDWIEFGDVGSTTLGAIPDIAGEPANVGMIIYELADNP